MKGKTLTLLGFLYVCYAVLTAYAALDRLEASYPPRTVTGQVHKRGLQQVDRDRRPMDLVNEEAFVGIRDEYRIIVWEKEGCHWCEKFSKRELPKLKQAGTRVTIKWHGKDKPEEGQEAVRYFPTIRVYRKNILVKEFVGYTKAEDILKVVKYRVVLLR